MNLPEAEGFSQPPKEFNLRKGFFRANDRKRGDQQLMCLEMETMVDVGGV